MKPMEVEILVAEVGWQLEDDQIFRISYDGTVVDEEHRTVLGGDADAISERLNAAAADDASLDLGAALRGAVTALAGPDRVIPPAELEVAILDRSQTRRAFRRLTLAQLEPLLTAPGELTGGSAMDGLGGGNRDGDMTATALLLHRCIVGS